MISWFILLPNQSVSRAKEILHEQKLNKYNHRLSWIEFFLLPIINKYWSRFLYLSNHRLVHRDPPLDFGHKYWSEIACTLYDTYILPAQSMISHGDESDVCLPSMIAVNYNTGRLFVCQLCAERVQSNDPPWEERILRECKEPLLRAQLPGDAKSLLTFYMESLFWVTIHFRLQARPTTFFLRVFIGKYILIKNSVRHCFKLN